mmetsp:Transcript_30242/g.29561  ORF Transcript_30242/g.29561 Transcript_30242/m.29561 type:complete len:230 (+) Transcript_30242:2732-3421(+)
MTWDSVVDADLPTLGYIVQMLVESKWETIYDASTNPDALSHTQFGLNTGEEYLFKVNAVNFNGPSDDSSILTVYACGVPSGFAAPRYVTSTQTSITIEWDPPTYDGGCPIQDYAVYRDDGALTLWTEVNPSGSYVRNDPYTRFFECTTFPGTAVAGDYFSFYIEAFNLQDSVNSLESPPFILASIPDTPTAGPLSDSTVTNANQIKITYTAVGSDGGSTILSYEVQMGT